MSNSHILNLQRSGSGPQLILVHGVAGSLRIWDPVATVLEPNFEVIRLDLLGYGHSPKPSDMDYSPQVHVEAVRSTLAHYDIHPPYNLVGLSMGASLVLEYAKLWPDEVAKVVCIGLPAYRSPDEARQHMHQSFWTRMALERPIIGRIAIYGGWFVSRHWRWLAGTLAPSIYTPIMAQESAMASYLCFKSSLIHSMINYRVESALASTNHLPKQFIHGSRDQWFSLGELKQVLEPLKCYQIKSLEEVGHNAVVIAPEETAEVIKNFVTKGKTKYKKPINATNASLIGSLHRRLGRH